jgi:hypothetical protein
MTRIRIGAAALGLALLLGAGAARAQETTGRVTGRVTDQETGLPLGGVTVIVAGPQGEDAVITSDKGEYSFTTLPVGTYVIRFYAANTSTQVEQPGVVVAAEKTVRVNAKISAAAATAAQQTYVIATKAPMIDIGSARVESNFDEKFMNNVPLGRTYGDVIERAPGAFVDGSGNVSIGGATGLENIYLVNGLNVTGLRFGNLESGASSIGGGSNLPLEFLSQIGVNAGGYQAEYGGAMGGVINTVLRSGSNEFHGSAFGYWSPYWLAGNPNIVQPVGSSLTGVRKRDFDDSIGAEVGGPIIKDKLFFWVGFAPRITDTHVLRLTYAEQEDPNHPGQPLLNANGLPVTTQTDWTARIPETHRTYYYAGTLDWLPLPDNKLTLSIVGTPSFNDEVKSQYGINSYASDPRTAVESLTKANTDVSAHWVSKLLERRWQIDVLAGMHNEYFYDRSPDAALNNLNEVQYGGANLWDLEHAAGCQPTATNTADGFQPCPVNPFYQSGGFGKIEKYNAYRWTGEIKSTHMIEAGGHNELKYGWHLELGTFDLTRYYSGPAGAHAFSQIFLPGNQSNVPPYFYNTTTFFGLEPGQTPASSNLDPTSAANYRDQLDSTVKSLSNTFFLQDSYSPSKLRNLTLNAGLRLELQKLYDTNGTSFLSTDNLSPRLSAVYDPFSDGRSKLSVSYGRYYEQIPLDVAARYFSGENYVQQYGPLVSEFGYNTGCPPNLQNGYNWKGAGEYKQCGAPLGTGAVFNSEYAQKNIQGQYHNEIVATAERQIMDDMTVRIDYQHRWLGNIIEDGYGPGFQNGVLGNPGNVPQSAIDAANHELQQAQMTAAAMPNDPAAQAAAATAQYNLGTLQTLRDAPAPERTYDAITLSLNKRFAKNWLTRASYTYSRLIGNYEGLYQQETNYIAPNGNNSLDAPELNVNQNGPLPNDRPHLFKLDGFYRHPLGKGIVTFGVSFTAQSGMPRNYVGNLQPGTAYQIVMLLPRGDAGRTPTVSQFNGKIAYARPLGPRMNLEGFLDLFNLFNQQAALLTDDNYTFDAAPPIVNGTTQDLKFAKTSSGGPISKNPNFGQPLAYQDPFSARLGLRLTF